jgi:hypothetical protein
VRNSSLVEWSGADNVSGLKHGTDALDFCFFEAGVVGERRQGVEAVAEAYRGALSSANVGMSNVQGG